MDRADVVIVGAGHGGAQVAAVLRQRKFEGTILIVGEEPEIPYERPPLSKDYFFGEKPFERILLRQPRFWANHNIALMTGAKVVSVDAQDRTVGLADGRTITYGDLVWAAGGKPRAITCSGNALPGVFSVRTRADVDGITEALRTTNNVVVIGGGYIGLEAAAVLSKLGKSVTVLEAQERVLARVAGVALSRFYEEEHRAHGVDVRVGVTVDCILGEDKVTGVRLAGGTVLPAEMVIVGIGIVPAVEPLIEAGAEGGNGVAVDEHCRTSLPNVYAIGDCALHANAFAEGMPIRLESVQNANDMAMIAAKAITGEAERYQTVPWFWSNQYDLRLQTVGLSTGHDEVVLRGDPARRSFSVVYLKQGKVVALDCVNATKDYVQGKALVATGARMTADQLADCSVPLKELALAA